MGEPDKPNDRTLINLRVSVDKKQEWETYLEETGAYPSVSQLIRKSVQKEINSDHESTPQSPALESDIAELKDEMREVKSDLKTLVSDHYESKGIQDLANQVRDEIEPLPKPTGPVEVPENVEMDKGTYRRRVAAETIIIPDDAEQNDEEGVNKQTAKAIANRINASPQEVEKAIQQLQDDFLPVVEVEINGETHYFMEQ